MNDKGSMIHLVVHGIIPSKKNSKKMFVVRGRIIICPSTNYEKWHKIALQELNTAQHSIETMESVQSITLTFYAQTKRLYDLSNKADSIMDTLVDAGILKDDNYSVVPELILKHGGHDKENPRCEIEIVK